MPAGDANSPPGRSVDQVGFGRRRARRALFGFAWSILPRRIALVAVASLAAFFVAIVGIGLGLTMLVLHVA